MRRRGFDRADAQDLVQGFFVFLLQSKAYAQTDRNKGKFRSFLLASLKHYLSDVWDRERALKRGGNHEFVLLEDEMDAAETLYASESVAATLDEEQRITKSGGPRRWWHVRWSVSGRSLRAGGRRELFRGLQPFLTGGTGLPSQEETAARLEMPIETLRSHLSRLRARYRELLREEVARTIAIADDVDEELRHLCGILIAHA